MNPNGAPRKYTSKTAERRALGLCVRCDTPSASYYCPTHAAEHRAVQERRKAKRKRTDREKKQMNFEAAKTKASQLADTAREAASALSTASGSESIRDFRDELETAENEARDLLEGIERIKESLR